LTQLTSYAFFIYYGTCQWEWGHSIKNLVSQWSLYSGTGLLIQAAPGKAIDFGNLPLEPLWMFCKSIIQNCLTFFDNLFSPSHNGHLPAWGIRFRNGNARYCTSRKSSGRMPCCLRNTRTVLENPAGISGFELRFRNRVIIAT